MRGYSAIFTPSGHYSAARLAQLGQAYEALEAYFAAHSIMPTARELGAALNVSQNAVTYRLEQMQALGWIARDGRERSIVLRGIKE